MIDISEVARTLAEKRKTSYDQFYVQFLKAFPLFQSKSRDQLLLLTWLFSFTLVGFKCNIEVDPSSVIVVIDGEINVSNSKRGTLKPKQMHVVKSHEILTANKDSEILVLKAQNYQYFEKNAHRSIREEEDFIKKCQFTRQMNQEDIRKIQSRGKFQSYQTGQTVYAKGSEPKGFYIVRKGSFVLKKSLLIANLFYKKINVSELFEGEVIGYGELMDSQETRECDLVCNTADGQLIFLKREYFYLVKSSLTRIHEERKTVNQKAEQRNLETLSNVLPFISPVNQNKLFRISTTHKLKRYVTHSFTNNDFQQQQTFFINSYSTKKVKQQKKSISNRKNRLKPVSSNLNDSKLTNTQNSNSYTVCQTMTNQGIHQKHDKFQKFRRQKSQSRTMQVQTPFKELARSFRHTYEQQKLKQICQGGCKRNCRRKYL